MHIARHEFDRERAKTAFKSAAKELRDELKIFNGGSYFVLRDMYLSSLRCYCFSAVFEKNTSAVRENLRLFCETALTNHQMATHIEQNISFAFRGKKYEWMPPDVDYMVSDQGYITSFMAAVISSDMEFVRGFSALDVDKVQEVSSLSGARYSSFYAKFLQQLFTKGAPHLQNLIRATEKLNKKEIPEPILDYALFIVGPQFDLFTSLLTNDTDSFNKQMINALQLHKRFYQTNENELISEGLISLPLTAIKLLAIDRGFQINITSDYFAE